MWGVAGYVEEGQVCRHCKVRRWGVEERHNAFGKCRQYSIKVNSSVTPKGFALKKLS